MKNINKIKDDIYREIVERTVDGGEYSDEELYELIEEKVLKKSHEVYIAQSEKESITKSVYNSMRGMDVLQELIDNPDITEIMVNVLIIYLSRIVERLKNIRKGLWMYISWRMLYNRLFQKSTEL